MKYYKNHTGKVIVYTAVDGDNVWATTNEECKWKPGTIKGWESVADQFTECNYSEIWLVVGYPPK